MYTKYPSLRFESPLIASVAYANLQSSSVISVDAFFGRTIDDHRRRTMYGGRKEARSLHCTIPPKNGRSLNLLFNPIKTLFKGFKLDSNLTLIINFNRSQSVRMSGIRREEV